MRYSTAIIAASAFAGLVCAQNSTDSYDTPIPCCSVSADQVPEDTKQTWCNANQNTCVELCGGRGQLGSNGNVCDADTLEFSCTCRNGTDISDSLSAYTQSVPGQMCNNFWFDSCINATGQDAQLQRNCEAARDAECGTLSTDGASDDTSSASSSPTSGSPSATSGSSSPDSTDTAETSAASPTPTEGAAANLAAYGSATLAGGLFALFGLAL
ncbi:acetyl-CoA synthetase-like protein [Stemphylium lycopersici]|nr:acetyl-CoA synthetase-like protein [Stemphylium lycopersici]